MAGMCFGSPPVCYGRRCATKMITPSSRASLSPAGSFEDISRDPAAKRASLEQAGNILNMDRGQVLHSCTGPRGKVSLLSRPEGGTVDGRDFQVEFSSFGERRNGGAPGLLSRELGGEREGESLSRPSDSGQRQLGQIVEFPRRSLERVPKCVGRSWDLARLQVEHGVFTHSLVITAYGVAGHAHQGQWRKNGEPVLAHCVETAKILSDLNADDVTVAAALLHDVLDDTSMTQEELTACVGSDVCGLVRKVGNVSRLSQLVRDSRGMLAAVDYSKLRDILVAVSDARVVLIKLADRVHNMRTLSALPIDKQIGVADETLKVFAPLAERLNSWTLKSELEDLAFAVLEPQKYVALKTEYDDIVQRCQTHQLREALNGLKAALDEENIVYEDISGRPKNLYAVNKKMEKKGYGSTREVLDLLAVRIVVKSKEDCYAALEKVHSLWKPVPGRLKDYIRSPKANGYQSIHEDVQMDDGSTFEVQIRTNNMHYIAEHGLAAHWRYKEDCTEIVSDFVAARTLWSQYVLNWVLDLNDKKFRPSDWPDGRSIWRNGVGLPEIFGTRGDESVGCRHRQQPCPRPVTEEDFWEPLYVAVNTSDGLEICQLKRGCTLVEFLQHHSSLDHTRELLPMVNNERVEGSYALRFGDVLEFLDKQPCMKGSLNMFTMTGLTNLNLGPGSDVTIQNKDTQREAVLG